MLSDYTIAISTCDREPQYIFKTVESVLSGTDNPIKLYVSGVKSDYLKSLYGNERIEIYVTPQEEWDKFKNKGPICKNAENQFRVIQCADHTKNLIYFEDDIDLSNDWHKHLDIRKKLADAKYPDGYILAMYACYNFKGGKIAEYGVKGYYGNQGLLISKNILTKLSNQYRYIRMLGAKRIKSEMPSDFTLKDFMKLNNVQLLSTIPHLVQHAGVVSTGCGGAAPSKLFRKTVNEGEW